MSQYHLPILLSTMLLGASPASLAMRCGSHLVELGDLSYQVRRHCGEPEFIDHRRVQRSASRGLVDQQHSVGALAAEQATIESTVEQWYYNFGPRRLNRLLTLENQRVIDIEILDYGD